ncbi:TonB-dependent receptor [Asticcacaulis sp. SL142]|uniref:TonB-dependent receptor n=1 Tax=Asticcacaulis sp. SL142 TaxID=2995155 RepID=UPI00226CEBDC|nr:TonB-dependent receptor [Asticcacaulis sp. SL142]WAC48265.1 TonB-dependent receptor [Asticcacaulis sp. SL142]
MISPKALLRCGSAIILAAAVLPGLGYAQSAPEAQTAQDGVTVVTVQKRREDARSVPVSVSALSAAALEKHHVADYADLARLVPGLSFTNTGNSGLSRISLRGVSSSEGAATVGVYLNDVSLTLPNQFFTGVTMPRIFDLERVEVLRGPQGTLFGDSSMGGTIRFITKAPRLEDYSGYMSAEVSSTEGGDLNHKIEGAANLPLNDQFALRIAAVNEFQSGFVDHVDSTGQVDRDNVNSERTTAARATLLFVPSDSLKVTASLQWQKVSSADTGIFNPALPKFQQDKIVREPSRDNLYVPSLTIEKTFGDLTFTSVTSYAHREFARTFDATIFDSSYVAFTLDPNFGTNYDTLAALPGIFPNTDTTRSWSQEFRLASPGIKESGKRYEWQAGLYVSSLRVTGIDDEYVQGLNETVQQLYGRTVEDLLGYAAPDDRLGYFHTRSRYQQASLFAEGSYLVTPKLKATLGLRYTKAESRYRVDEGGWLYSAVPATDSAEQSSSPVTPKLAFVYELTSTVNLFASASKGFRLGGQNAPVPTYCASALSSLGLTNDAVKSFGSDSLWSYEGGIKARLFSNRVSLNASAFYVDWEDVQQRLLLGSCGYNVTVNAGTARSQGGEFEATARLTDNLVLNVSGTVTDATITDAAVGSGAVNGQHLLSVPRNNYTIGLDYTRALGEGMVGYASIAVTHTGRSNGSFSRTNTDFERPAYDVVNTNLGLETRSLTWSIFAKNLFDEDKIIQQPSVLFTTHGLTIRPRTVGINVRKTF